MKKIVLRSGPPKARLAGTSGVRMMPSRDPSGANTQVPPGPVHTSAVQAFLSNGEDWKGLAFAGGRAAGAAAAGQAQWREADEHYRDATAIVARWPVPFTEADLRHEWGRVLVEAGDAEGARARFAEALDLYKSLGAAPSLVRLVETDVAALA